MRQCVLHIGMNKTGSSSIQRYFSSIQEIPGWKYIRVNNAVSQSLPFYCMFDINPARHNSLQRHGIDNNRAHMLGAKWKLSLSRSLSAINQENIIISGEGINKIYAAGIADLQNYLRHFFDRIRVVGYVRHPSEYLASAFQQRLKDRKIDLCELDSVWPNYRERFEKFDTEFGIENVELVKYSRDAFPGQCVIADFCMRIGCQMPTPFNERYNKSLSREAIGILYAHRKYGQQYAPGPETMNKNRAVVTALREVGYRKFSLGGNLINQVLNRYRDDVVWMEDRLGESLSEYIDSVAATVSDENALLGINRHDCVVFIKSFQAQTGLSVNSRLPCKTTLDAEVVADIVESCYQAYSESHNHIPRSTLVDSMVEKGRWLVKLLSSLRESLK